MFPAINFGALERYRVRAADGTPNLADVDPSDGTALPFSKEELERATAADVAQIDRLQDILYAQAKHAVLVVLQGMDTSGKDGTIRKVFGPIDPLGVVATSFKKPTPRELSHDFLWRIHKAVPPAGMIGIFNRSHYEDVLVARVHGLVSGDRIEARYGQINAFERHLAENDVTILPDRSRRLQHRMGALVHRSGGPEMVPQRRRRAHPPEHARSAGFDRSARPAGPRQDTNRVAARSRLSRMRRITRRQRQGWPIPGVARAGGRRGSLRRIPLPTH
jgi:hypothetical protein